MTAGRRYLMLLAIVLISALPAAGAYLYYLYTDNPLMQPLGITRERLAEVEGQTELVAIVVHVDWGRDRTEGVTKRELRDFIRRSISMRTDDFVRRFKEVPGDRIGITFVVGPNRYGPYSPGQILNGIVPSAVALAMMKDYMDDPRVNRE